MILRIPVDFIHALRLMAGCFGLLAIISAASSSDDDDSGRAAFPLVDFSATARRLADAVHNAYPTSKPSNDDEDARAIRGFYEHKTGAMEVGAAPASIVVTPMNGLNSTGSYSFLSASTSPMESDHLLLLTVRNELTGERLGECRTAIATADDEEDHWRQFYWQIDANSLHCNVSAASKRVIGNTYTVVSFAVAARQGARVVVEIAAASSITLCLTDLTVDGVRFFDVDCAAWGAAALPNRKEHASRMVKLSSHLHGVPSAPVESRNIECGCSIAAPSIYSPLADDVSDEVDAETDAVPFKRDSGVEGSTQQMNVTLLEGGDGLPLGIAKFPRFNPMTLTQSDEMVAEAEADIEKNAAEVRNSGGGVSFPLPNLVIVTVSPTSGNGSSTSEEESGNADFTPPPSVWIRGTRPRLTTRRVTAAIPTTTSAVDATTSFVAEAMRLGAATIVVNGTTLHPEAGQPPPCEPKCERGGVCVYERTFTAGETPTAAQRQRTVCRCPEGLLGANCNILNPCVDNRTCSAFGDAVAECLVDVESMSMKAPATFVQAPHLCLCQDHNLEWKDCKELPEFQRQGEPQSVKTIAFTTVATSINEPTASETIPPPPALVAGLDNIGRVSAVDDARTLALPRPPPFSGANASKNGGPTNVLLTQIGHPTRLNSTVLLNSLNANNGSRPKDGDTADDEADDIDSSDSSASSFFFTRLPSIRFPSTSAPSPLSGSSGSSRDSTDGIRQPVSLPPHIHIHTITTTLPAELVNADGSSTTVVIINTPIISSTTLKPEIDSTTTKTFGTKAVAEEEEVDEPLLTSTDGFAATTITTSVFESSPFSKTIPVAITPPGLDAEEVEESVEPNMTSTVEPSLPTTEEIAEAEGDNGFERMTQHVAGDSTIFPPQSSDDLNSFSGTVSTHDEHGGNGFGEVDGNDLTLPSGKIDVSGGFPSEKTDNLPPSDVNGDDKFIGGKENGDDKRKSKLLPPPLKSNTALNRLGAKKQPQEDGRATVTTSLSWIIAIAVLGFLSIALLTASVCVGRYMRQSRRLHGKYNPAREENAVASMYSMPTIHHSVIAASNATTAATAATSIRPQIVISSKEERLI